MFKNFSFIFIFLSIFILYFIFIFLKIEYFIEYNNYKLIENDYDYKIPSIDIKEYKNIIPYTIISNNLKIEKYELEQLLNNFFKNKYYNYVKIISSNKNLVKIENNNLKYMYITKLIIKDNSIYNNNIAETWDLIFIKNIKDNIYKDIEIVSFQKENNSNIVNKKGYYDFLENEYTHFRIKNQLGLFEPFNTSLND